jgi:ribosome-binding factor A
VRELLKREIGEAIRREFHVNEVGLITVNDVDVAAISSPPSSSSASSATPTSRSAACRCSTSIASASRGSSAKSVVLKYTPTLKFVVDDSIVRGNRVLQIMEELEKPRRPLDSGPTEETVKSYPKIIDRISKSSASSKTFCIVGHIRPDGDCIGSQLGLALALRNEGKKVTAGTRIPFRKNTNFSIPTACFKSRSAAEKFDCVIATDCASFERWARSASASATGKFSSTLTITKATRATAT